MQREGNQHANEQREIQRIGAMHISHSGPSVDVHAGLNKYPSMSICLILRFRKLECLVTQFFMISFKDQNLE